MKPLTESQQFILNQIPHDPESVPCNAVRDLNGAAIGYQHHDMRILVRRGLVYRKAKFNALVSRLTPIVVPAC